MPEYLSKEQERKTLICLNWKYDSNMTTILEEKLVYGTIDLLACLGGAIGIFVGYSFFDLTKHVIDIAFYFVYRIITTQ